MTPLQKKREQAKARKARERIRIDKRKAKRAVKAAPRNALRIWATHTSDDVCAVCGIGVTVKLNKDGSPKLNKLGKPVLIPLHAHHLLPKERYREFRTMPINRIDLCPMHHKFSKYSAHRNPIWFAVWLRRNRPEQYEWCKANMGKDPAEGR